MHVKMCTNCLRHTFELTWHILLKKWAKYFKDSRRLVKLIYMGAIGRLVEVEDMNVAEKLIKSLFILAMCECAGDGAPQLQEATNFIKKTIDSSPKDTEVLALINASIEANYEEDEEVIKSD